MQTASPHPDDHDGDPYGRVAEGDPEESSPAERGPEVRPPGEWWPGESGARSARRPEARRVRAAPGGPVLVEGPVEVVLPDGTTARSDRFMVAVCACRRSRTYPWCDTSHRRRSHGV